MIRALLVLPMLLAPADASPRFSAERGLYEAAFALSITAEAADASIVYSVDGSEPAEPWGGALLIDGTTVVRAATISPDGERSPVATHTFLFIDDVLASPVMDPRITGDATYGPIVGETLRALPSVSVVGADLSTTEQAVSVEWIDPDGEDAQIDCGARKVGGHSLTYEKNNIRLYFRGDYGAGRLTLELYEDYATGVPPADDHDALMLRSGSHDSVFYLGAAGQYLRNRWMDEAQLELGHIAPHGRYAHLYAGGRYEGLYHVRERFNAAFLAEYLGGEEEDYEAINGGSVVDGDGSAWAQVEAHYDDYEAVRDWVNVENFVDYMLLNFYAGNDWDWNPTQNWMAAGPAEAGRGGFVFHASDSDICLYYDWTINILHEPGPSYLFAGLRDEWHPDFATLLADRTYALLEGDGPLTPGASAARYSRLAEQIDAAVVAESARWGQGWWDRDDEWETEKARLLEDYFPYRTGELLRQLRAAGWYPLDAPDFDRAAGWIEAGDEVTVTGPDGLALWVTTDGQDPRLPGGAVRDGAAGPGAEQRLRLERSAVVSARLRRGDTWGPLRQAFYEIDAPPDIVLNEWNAVASDALLDDGDPALGRVPGNGGDWFELLVMTDALDLRGWRITLSDRVGPAGELTFTDDPALAGLRAGTLITVAESLPEDAAYDPDAGDWRFHLQAADGASGRYLTAADFDVSHLEWQLTLWDRDGAARFGPTGEGIAPADGISSSEVGLLQITPSDLVRRDSAAFTDGDQSTFGAPNAWPGGVQDLSGLRGEVEPELPDVDSASPDTASPGDSDTPEGGQAGGGQAAGGKPDGCGCVTPASGGGPVFGGLLLLSLALSRRSRGGAGWQK